MFSCVKKGSVAVITGAAVGIGYAIAEKLAHEGMKLVLLDKDPLNLTKAVQQLRETYPQLAINYLVGDVATSSVQDQLLRIAISTGKISLLINNAAILHGANPWENVSQWRNIIEINFWSLLMLQQKFIPILSKQSGYSAIVNLGSKEGITTPPGNAAYAVSKAAVRVLTEQLAHELRETFAGKIRAHLLIPGYTFTPMNFPEMNKETIKPDSPWTAEQVAERLIQGLRAGDFYIFCEDNEVTHELDQRRMQWSIDDLIHNRPALSRWHPDWREKFSDFISR